VGLREKKEYGVPKKITPFFWSYILYFLPLGEESKLCRRDIFSRSNTSAALFLSTYYCLLGRDCSPGEWGFLNGVSIFTKSMTRPESNREELQARL